MNGDTAKVPRRIASLKELCQQKLARHCESIRYLGAIPQFLVVEALARCTPEQLESIELLNPHIREDNEPLWRLHFLKKYRGADSVDPASGSWREKYREMRLQDELRAQEIMDRVRGKMAEVEKERNARKIRIASMAAASARRPRAGAGTRSSGASKGLSLVQKARLETKAHMSMLRMTPSAIKRPADIAVSAGTRSIAPGRPARVQSTSQQSFSQRHRQQPEKPQQPDRLSHKYARASIGPESKNSQVCQPKSTALPRITAATAAVAPAQRWPKQQLSPAGSPAHSPTYTSSSSSYSPPYLSSSTPSCSPTHSSSAYSPPYVPDCYPSASSPGDSSKLSYSPKHDMFEVIFGTSSSSASTTLPPTVVIKQQTRIQKHRPAKRKREAEKDSDRRPSPEH
ncbi:hypothetical protein LPJ56_000197 [Coemansia sp. RSA 2599]|nr:hypothetical protein LPJ56_000197 [Coemansia sp. RSA 2599]